MALEAAKRVVQSRVKTGDFMTFLWVFWLEFCLDLCFLGDEFLVYFDEFFGSILMDFEAKIGQNLVARFVARFVAIFVKSGQMARFLKNFGDKNLVKNCSGQKFLANWPKMATKMAS